MGNARHLIGYVVCADGKDDEGLAICVQTGCGFFVEINDMVGPLGNAGLLQLVHIHMGSNATHFLDPADVIGANGNDEDIKPRSIIGIFIVLWQLWGQMVEFPGNCLSMWMEFLANHASGDNAGRIDELKH